MRRRSSSACCRVRRGQNHGTLRKNCVRAVRAARQKKISAVELAKDVFARTKAVEDKVQGYVTVAEESALAQAEAVDKSARAAIRCPRWPVSPIAIKDNICTRAR